MRRTSTLLDVNANGGEQVLGVHGADVVEAVLVHVVHALHHVAVDVHADVGVRDPGRLPESLVVAVETQTGADEGVGDLLARAEAAERWWVGHVGCLKRGRCLLRGRCLISG